MVTAGSTWSTSSVNALLAGLIGIAATLLGSLTTYLFQSRTAERARSFERDERLRYEQVNACSAFASAITELKRGLITLWFYAGRPGAGSVPVRRRWRGSGGGSSRAGRRAVKPVTSTEWPACIFVLGKGV